MSNGRPTASTRDNGALAYGGGGPRVARWTFGLVLCSAGWNYQTVAAGVVDRPVEARAVVDFLAAASAGPTGLVVEGEPGIGKTTLWLAALALAGERGFRVLSARPPAAESVLPYGSLADLLAGVDESVWADLPDVQRLAVDRALLRADPDGRVTDQRAVAAAFLSVVEGLADESAVLVAIDDLQWLDPASVHVVAFAARRVSGPVGVLATVRTQPEIGGGASWLQLPSPDGIRRIGLGPLSVGGLHAVLSERLGRSFPRPTMTRIQEISGGNPFYALELARAMQDATPTGDRAAEMTLPGTLAELVQARIGRLDAHVHDALLAAACLATPTVELVAHATGNDAEHVVELLAEAEDNGIVGFDGHRLRFAHPLLARGVYTDAAPARRRMMHRRLAEIVEQPELVARHLALAATTADPRTLTALDAAAEMARLRGAPAAAAELLDLAISLGGDTPQRRIQSASHHFYAGDLERARGLLEETVAQPTPGTLRAAALCLLAAVRIADGSFLEAARLLEHGVEEAGENLALRVQVLVTLSFALLNAGQLDAAVDSIEDAVVHAERLGHAQLLGEALGTRVMMRFMGGGGLDEPDLARALELEDHQADVPLARRPSMQNALLLAWTGRLERAGAQMASIRRNCIEQGQESELNFVAFQSALCEIWRGNFADAATIAEDTMVRALQLGGDLPLFVALTMRAMLGAYAGRVDEARRDAGEALAASRRCVSSILAEWPVAILGFLEVSLERYPAALTTLAPLLSRLDAAPQATEIIAASFVSDAVEAMIGLGRLAEAEPLIDILHRNGGRLDRAWMLAVSARCRAMLLAAHGDLDAASLAVQQAMAEHDRLPMPFERARTQLLAGQLQRRHRQKNAASATLAAALDAFTRLDTPLWANRARAELARANVPAGPDAALTPSEQRVAELVAAGMTNRDVGAALFISPKTVEFNLARIYRKLGIHTRAELGRHIGHHDG
jgi:DNA-binding NarL/FixJ family response regulator